MMQKRAQKPEAIETRGWRVVDWNKLRNPPEIATSFAYFCLFLLALAVLLLAGILFARVFYAAQYGAPDDLNKLLLAFGALVGAPFLVWRVLIAAQQTSIARETMYTTLFTKAVEQLGATREVDTAGSPKTVPNTEVRLGAIYALERIARDSMRDHWAIMETLCAYVRENAKPAALLDDELLQAYKKKPWRRSDAERELLAEDESRHWDRVSVDIQAALTVIGRRPENCRRLEDRLRQRTKNPEAYRLTFTGTNLREADFRGLDFDHAVFDRCDLDQAKFRKASLRGTSFYRTRLQSTDLSEADLSFACMIASVFMNTRLFGANLSSALMSACAIESATMSAAVTNQLHACGIDFGSADGLRQRQIDVAVLDDDCSVPDEIKLAQAKKLSVVSVRDGWLKARDEWMPSG